MSTSIKINIDENGQSINGRVHLAAMRVSNNRLKVFNQSLAPYALIAAADFKPPEERKCRRILKNIRAEICEMDTLLVLPKIVHDSLSKQQEEKLADGIAEIRKTIADSMALATKVAVLMPGSDADEK